MQNIILRALGAKETVQSDIAEIEVLPKDILLLTTDGLVRHVEDEQILHVIEEAPTLEQACDELIQCAKGAGGSDNITCLLVKIVKRAVKRSLPRRTAANDSDRFGLSADAAQIVDISHRDENRAWDDYCILRRIYVQLVCWVEAILQG